MRTELEGRGRGSHLGNSQVLMEPVVLLLTMRARLRFLADRTLNRANGRVRSALGEGDGPVVEEEQADDQESGNANRDGANAKDTTDGTKKEEEGS